MVNAFFLRQEHISLIINGCNHCSVLLCCCCLLIQIFLYYKTLMNAKEIIMIAARMGFVQTLRDHTTATVPEGIAVMVGIVQVLMRSSHSQTRLSTVTIGLSPLPLNKINNPC